MGAPTEAEPSSARSLLLVTDISNLLLCVREILPAICSDAAELMGYAPRNKVLRDIHAKCHELLVCMIIRGSPLSTLYKVFRRGVEGVAAFLPLNKSAAVPWVILTSPHLFPRSGICIDDLLDGPAIALETSVLVSQPQALWSLLLKILTMRNYKVTVVILNQLMQQLNQSSFQPVSGTNRKKSSEDKNKVVTFEQCDGFLCSGGGDCSLATNPSQIFLPPSMTVTSLVHIVAVFGSQQDLASVLIPALEKHSHNWGSCLDRREVWNLGRPPWLEALISPLEPILSPVVETLMNVSGNAVGVAMDCLIQLADCLPEAVLRAAIVLEDALPADVHPLAGSVLVQLVITALYSKLQAAAIGNAQATALAEVLCNLDQSTAHDDKIEAFIHIAVECIDETTEVTQSVSTEAGSYTTEVLVSNLLLTSAGRRALKVMWQFLQHSWKWILGQLGVLEPNEIPPSSAPLVPATASRPAPTKLLHTMFHVGQRPFDQLLAGTWELDWNGLLHTPLALTPERLWNQLSSRSEFHESPSMLTEHDTTVVATLSEIFQSIAITPLSQ
ncbi:hypothetical protein L9F63_026823 [Diploptera punctata]|uniref:Uncharacterized protein n=1 Tax=Diploptera punctata TaxID=6984 RepID=A0AAD8AHY1_DIPPU|nr:hypothetical protein L9F63_026823 [Diploptera punctata]